jgi:SPP1 gp7 family putative phage head morphogenesis protein
MAIRLKDLASTHVQAIINGIRLDLDTGEMEDELAETLEEAVTEAGRAAIASLGREPDEFSIDDEAASRFLSRRVGDRIVRDLDDFSKSLTAGINERTRGILGALFARAIEEDKGLSGIVKALRLTFDEMSLWRANTIARTETSFALNFGQAQGYRQAGYEYVQLIDGDDPDTDQPCRDANGMRISIDLYEEHPVQHPNCRRSAVAISAEEAEEEGVDDEQFLELVAPEEV